MTHLNNEDIARLDWAGIAAQLDEEGYAVLPGLLDGTQARSIAALIGTASTGRQAPLASGELGRGDMLYLAHALPEPLNAWHAAFYQHLAPIANRWNKTLGTEERFPASFEVFFTQQKKAGSRCLQSILSRLRTQDYQALHQHAKGEPFFPLQLVALLSEPEKDFTGGEFVMTEQRPRMQSRPMVLPLRQGDAAIITVAQRPFRGSTGVYRVNIKHAISRVRSGERIGLELLFHDAP